MLGVVRKYWEFANAQRPAFSAQTGLTLAICVAMTAAANATVTEKADRDLTFGHSSTVDRPIAEEALPAYSVAMRPERDSEAIIQDYFDEAVRNRSAGLLIKFIARYADHPLAGEARRMLEEGNLPPARKTATEWVDSKIVEFDAARRAGPSALRDFAAKYPDHPLAGEARRLLKK